MKFYNFTKNKSFLLASFVETYVAITQINVNPILKFQHIANEFVVIAVKQNNLRTIALLKYIVNCVLLKNRLINLLRN